MLRSINQFCFQPDLFAADGRIIYAHLGNLATESDNVRRLVPPSELEYVFQLISSHFLHIEARKNDFVPQEHDGKAFYEHLFFVFSLPFKGDGGDAQNEQWNDVVNWVSYDFSMRKNDALRGKCTYEQLDYFIRDHIENFDYEDRVRLDPEKLINLILFVYDYCMLTMRESQLRSDLDLFVKGRIQIREKEFNPPLRVCASIDKYNPYFNEPVEGEPWAFENYDLPRVELSSNVRNPHASDSNCSAMFVDMMHKFFLAFGLKRRANTEWAKAEKMLINDLLRLLGLCKSKPSANNTTYVTTVLKEYGNYFSSCNLRTWIREDQAYSYLMFCSVESFVRRGQKNNEPFLSLDDYSVVQEELTVPETPTDNGEDNNQEPLMREISHEELPDDIRGALQELSGVEVKVTHTDYDLVNYASISEKAKYGDIEVEWNPRLEYVQLLIDSAFDYITLFPMIPRVLVVRNDMENPMIQEHLVASLRRDLLERMDSIPRGIFSSKQATSFIKSFHNGLPKREERERFDDDKFYALFLFIFDYVYLNYEELRIAPHLKKFMLSEMQQGGKTYSSTDLIDDMLIAYLEHPYTFSCSDDESSFFQQFRKPTLYVPKQGEIDPVKHPSSNVKNKTAMFYDLFVRFFQAFGLSKRSDVKYLSDLENILVAELANCCGICGTASPTSVRRMYMDNQDYFQKSALALSIREDKYSYLLLNTMSDELFGPKTGLEQ